MRNVQSTHAAGTNAEGTPHTVHYGAGDKAQTSEPATVGQAQKDISANLPRAEEQPAPGVLSQAQNAASSAVASVGGLASAVSGMVLGGGKTEEAKAEKKKPEDPRVDKVSDENVESFVRAQHPSTTK
jgi:hypothetical protein